MTCMTTKKKFDVEDPEVVVLRNGRYAFRAECPWEGKNGKKLVAFKFCSAKDYSEQECRKSSAEIESPETEGEIEPPETEETQSDAPESEEEDPP